jgi:hypothetical protein
MITIENLTGRPVSLRLNSGTILHLQPRMITPEIVDVEIQSNAEMQKLLDRRVIALHEPAASAAGEETATAAERSAGKPSKK